MVSIPIYWSAGPGLPPKVPVTVIFTYLAGVGVKAILWLCAAHI
jgi:hypothetical protein